MSNMYFTLQDPLDRHTLGRAEQVNQIFFAIQAGFDLLPDPLDVLYSSQTYVVDTGTANSYVVELPRAPSAYRLGMTISMKAANANTGVSTINVNGLGIIPIKRHNGSDLLPSDILSGMVVTLVYDGTNFIMTGVHGAEVSLSMAWATSLDVVSGGLRGSRYYAQQAASSANAANQSANRAEGAAEQAEEIAGDLVENLPAIEAVADNIGDVVSVAGGLNAINTVSYNIPAISNVSDNLGDIYQVNSMMPQIQTVAGMQNNISNVVGMEHAITGVYDELDAITSVNANISAVIGVNSGMGMVAGVYSNLNHVENVSDNISDIITASNNIEDIQAAPQAAEDALTAANTAMLATELILPAQATDHTTGKGGAPLVAGNWYINTATGFIRAYTGSAWTNGLAGAVSVAYADILNAPFDTSDPGEAASTTPFVTGQFSDTVTVIGNTGTAQTLQPIDGGYYTATLTGNCTFTLDGVNAVPGRTSSLILKLTNDGTASRSVTFVSAGGGDVDFPGGSLDRTTTANRTDVYFAYTDDGANWVVSIPQKDIR